MTVGSNIKLLRFQKGWGPDDLAKASGVSRTAIHLVEQGISKPRARTVLQLAEALGVSVASIMGFEPLPGPVDTPAVVAGSIGQSPEETLES